MDPGVDHMLQWNLRTASATKERKDTKYGLRKMSEFTFLPRLLIIQAWWKEGFAEFDFFCLGAHVNVNQRPPTDQRRPPKHPRPKALSLEP